MMSASPLDPRTPVLVGVGTAWRSSTEPGAEVEPLDLMVEAAREALADCTTASIPMGSLARHIGSVAVPVGNWSYSDPARLVARAIGAVEAQSIRVEIGVAQSTPIRVAAASIRSGELDAALIVGGEAKASQQRVTRAGGTPRAFDDEAAVPDLCWTPQGEFMAPAEVDVGLWDPVAQYACIENALGHAEGRSHDELVDEIARLWHRMNRVARSNPAAAFPEPQELEFLRVPGPGNRPLASPYAKWHSTQWGVDQAAALVMCSAGLATELGIPLERWVVPRVLVESSHSLSMTRRVQLHRWPAMAVLGEAASSHLGAPLTEIEHVELYSCFPSAVRVQQRELGLDPEGTPTVLGGMAFAGGPFNNFSYQATAAIARRLRLHPGAPGMVTTVSGLLTKPGLAIWQAIGPGANDSIAWCGSDAIDEPLLDDLGAAAAAVTEACEVTAEHVGDATVATFTVTGEGNDEQAFVVADLPEAHDAPGRRWVGRSDDPTLLQAARRGELIGRKVHVRGDRCSSN